MDRETLAQELLFLYNNLGTNPDRNSDLVEGLLAKYGFEFLAMSCTRVLDTITQEEIEYVHGLS